MTKGTHYKFSLRLSNLIYILHIPYNLHILVIIYVICIKVSYKLPHVAQSNNELGNST